MVKGMKIRIQSLWPALAALAMFFGPQAMSGLVALIFGGRTGGSNGGVASLIGALIILCLVARWAAFWEVKEGRLILRRLFFINCFSIHGSAVCDSNWPWHFRLRTPDGRVHTLPLPDESVYGQPAKELLFSILEDEGAFVHHSSWRLAKGEDPAASFRPKGSSFKNLMFWGKMGAQLSMTLLIFVALSPFVAWWVLAPLILLAGFLAHQQLPMERRSFLAEWRAQHPGMTLQEALDSLDQEKGKGAITPEDREDATLVRQIGRDPRRGRISRLQLRTQTGKIGSTRWTEPVLGRWQRPPILSAGVRYQREELPGVVLKLDVAEARGIEG